MIVQPATAGAKGVDCITLITPATADALKRSGVDFAVRYLGALTVAERNAILEAGLALLAVGYSKKPGWAPSVALGGQAGAASAQHALDAGLPPGLTLFCDLEGPAPSATAADCVGYVNAWTQAVRGAGYRAGLYVGFGVPLSSRQLYEALSVDCYWHSGSTVPDVAVRGYCMAQDAKFNQVVAGVEVDLDVVTPDRLGGVPYWLVAT